MMKKLTMTGLVIIALAVLLSSCAFNRNTLIGSWKEEASGLVLQFGIDGKAVQSSPSAPESTIEIGYQFLNDNTIHIIGTQNVYTFSVEGDTLTLSAQGQAVTLTRVR